MSAELLRRINNLITIGTVTESKSVKGLSLARVKILNRVTDFLPVMQRANSFKRHAVPIRPGEQVVVLHPFGEGDSGVVLGSIFNKGEKEPLEYSDTRESIAYEDGTRISYDTETKELKIEASDKVTVICKTATIQASTLVDFDTPLAKFAGDVEVAGNISDSRGNLTGHQHSDTDGATSLPR